MQQLLLYDALNNWGKFMRYLILLLAFSSINVLADPGGYDQNAGGYDPSIAARHEADESAEKEKQFQEYLKREAPKNLKEMNDGDLCVAYGASIRGEIIGYPLSFKGASSMVIAEIKRRKLRADVATVKKERMRIGMTLCELYASRGFPDDSNRSVGKWGVHIQHVYSGYYVYSENGVVTSWQE